METGTQRATTDSTASSSNVSSSSTSDKPMEPSLRLMNTSEKPTGTDHRETGHVTSSSSKDRSTDGHASTKNPRCTSAASSTQTSKGRSAADKFIRIVTSTSSAIFQTSKELFPGGAQKLKWTEQWTAAEKEKYKSVREIDRGRVQQKDRDGKLNYFLLVSLSLWRPQSCLHYATLSGR